MRYKIFGQHTGLRVSELILGTGMFGTKWGHGADAEESRRIFDGYVEAGGNFLDTSDSYQFGESEALLGEIIESSRDDLVLATKYTQSADPKGSLSVTGNSRKAMVRSLEQSLKRLETDRVDLYWVHLERELLPMAAAYGLATVAWSPLGGGVLTGKYRKGETGRQTGMGGRLFHAEDTAQKTATLDTLEAIAVETGSNPGRVAIAWVGAKGAIPIIGPRTRAQLDDNLKAAGLGLTDDQVRRLDEVSAVSLGFPHELLANPATRDRIAGGRLALLDLPTQPVR